MYGLFTTFKPYGDYVTDKGEISFGNIQVFTGGKNHGFK